MTPTLTLRIDPTTGTFSDWEFLKLYALSERRLATGDVADAVEEGSHAEPDEELVLAA